MTNQPVNREKIRDFIKSELTRMSRARMMSNHSMAGADPVKLLAKANRREPMSVSEVSAMTGIPHGTVKWVEKRAKAKIRLALASAKGEEDKCRPTQRSER